MTDSSLGDQVAASVREHVSAAGADHGALAERLGLSAEALLARLDAREPWSLAELGVIASELDLDPLDLMPRDSDGAGEDPDPPRDLRDVDLREIDGIARELSEDLDHAQERVGDLRAELREASPVAAGAPTPVPQEQPDLSNPA